MNPSAILHIPHSSSHIPAENRSAFHLSDTDLREELLRMTDWFTDELFDDASGNLVTIRYPISRLVLDPERFEDDTREVMATRGMGMVYVKTSDGRRLRDVPSEVERRDLIDRYYAPHHDRLSKAAAAILVIAGRVLIVDCHSFSERPLPYELDQRADRPDICIGTDDFHTPTWLGDLAVSLFREAGFSVDRNRPFGGALVPGNYYQREPAVSGVMVEVNRGLYMNERTGEKRLDFDAVRKTVCEVTNALVAAHDFEHGTARQQTPRDDLASGTLPSGNGTCEPER